MKEQVCAGLRELLRRIETGEAGPMDWMLFGEVSMWWRMYRQARSAITDLK